MKKEERSFICQMNFLALQRLSLIVELKLQPNYRKTLSRISTYQRWIRDSLQGVCFFAWDMGYSSVLERNKHLT